jgi:DNA repair exonuclease SbcCD ATPase subunit
MEPMLYAPFCDRCGNNLSAFWKSVRPFVRQGYDQQWSQGGASLGLRDAFHDLKSSLSASARRWKLLPKPKGEEGQSEAVATHPSGTVREPEANLAEVETLREERDKLSERTRELEARLAAMVPITELNAVEYDNEDLRAELSRLKEDKEQSEARIAQLTESVRGSEAKLAEAVPKSELETTQSVIERLLLPRLSSMKGELEAINSEIKRMETKIDSWMNDLTRQ